jgi:hypothetical protein
MLSALAVVALIVGSVGATVSLNQNDIKAADQAQEPTVEVQSIESVDAITE